MTAYLIPTTQQFFDNNGDPLAGGMIYTCIAGASGYTDDYLKDTYTDSTGTTTNPNPIILDSAGRCNLWGDGTTYKLFIFNSSGGLVRADDNVACILGTASSSNIPDGSITYPKLSPTVTASAASIITGTSSTSFPTPAALSAVGIASLPSRAGQAGYMANRNFIDNAVPIIWQRGTSMILTNGTSGIVVDRFNSSNNAGTTTATVSSDTMTINSTSQPCAKFTNGSTGVSSYSSGAYLLPFSQTIEGYTLYSRALAGSSVTISVWMEVSVAGKYAIALQNATGSYSYVHTVTLAANTPTEVPFTVSIPTTSGLWNCPNANTRGALLTIGHVGGTSFQASSADTWLSGAYYTTADCVNWAATAGATVKIARIRMEEGTSLGVFETLPYNIDIARCQYFLPTYTGRNAYELFGFMTSSQIVRFFTPFPALPRAAITGVSIINPSTLQAEYIANSTALSLQIPTFYTRQGNLGAWLTATNTSTSQTVGGACWVNVPTNSIFVFTGAEL